MLHFVQNARFYGSQTSRYSIVIGLMMAYLVVVVVILIVVDMYAAYCSTLTI